MSVARRALCGTLALLMGGAPFWMLVNAGRPATRHALAAADRSIFTVALLEPALPHTAFEAAQPAEMNFTAAEDQTSRRDAATPAVSTHGALHEVVHEVIQEAYLPASQLTAWPQQLPQASSASDEDDSLSLPASWADLKTVVAVLMIDEQGEVRQVQLDDEALEQPLRQLLAQRLMALRFVPGKLYGRPVRSRLALELVLQ